MALSMIVTLLVAFTCILIIPLVHVAKRNGQDEIKRVSDLKEFKKILRTHNNVLCVFAKSEKAVTNWKMLGEVALDMRGLASILFINCGEDKKLCKKLKISPSPVEMKHYHEGEFNKDYDRKHTTKSIENFLLDPKGDIPWEEEATAQDVTHIENKQTLTKILTKEKNPVLVMFYAPWCGFCKRLKPDYALAATDLKGEAILAGMDVDRQENMQIRVDYNITGFPTLLYFKDGKMKMKYGGENSRDGFVKWMKNPTEAKEPEKETEWSDAENDVAHLTTDSFDGVIASNPSVLVMFYAPWCGHCKKMKPEYDEAAAKLKEDEVKGVIAAVDATKDKELAERYKVKGFPTVKYFKDGEEAWEYNERTADKIIAFMKDPQEPPPSPPAQAPWAETESEVQHLTDETFKSFLKKKKHTLVMFYAPWCGHCKKAKPEFMEAAEKLKEDSKVSFAALDCTVHKGTCGAHDVTGYPTFMYFNYGKNAMKYTGGREEDDFLNFMKDPQNPMASLPPPPPSRPSETWADAPGHENLHHLTDQTFDSFMKYHKSTLVMFYAPWCSHCLAMKPAYAEAATILKELGAEGVLATVDATHEKAVTSKYEVKGYPTLKYFENGEVKFEYSKGRTTGDIVTFMKSPSGPTPEPKWSDEPSKLHHLAKDTFADFISNKNNILVMFYAPWCPHCKKAKTDFMQAADVLSAESDKFLAVVDCTDTGDLCLDQEIKNYPTFKFYHNGSWSEYKGSPSRDAFVQYVQRQSQKKESAAAEDTAEKKEEL